MSSADANPPAEPAPPGMPAAPVAPEAAGARPPAFLWLWALVAGAIAAAIAGYGGEANHGRFRSVLKLPPNWDQIGPYDRNDIIADLIREDEARTSLIEPGADAKNTAVAYGLLGAALAGGLGLAGGLARRSFRSALIAGLVGVVAGGATGAIMSGIWSPIFFKALKPETGMALGMEVHAGIWVPIGAVAGLALGIGLGSARSAVLALIGGLAGAALGTMAYEMANGILFPVVRLDKPVPPAAKSRLMAIASVALCTALGAAVGVQERAPRKATPAAPLD